MFFQTPGKQNTAETLRIALEAARELNLHCLVVASGEGTTVEELLKLDTSGLKIVCVTRSPGFRTPGVQDFPAQKRAELEERGVCFVTTTHVLSGGERGISRKFGGISPVELVAASLRMLGQGVKVCVEIAVMALDCGAIPYGEPVVAVGGTGKGADTAVVLRAAHAADLLDCKVDRILCKPIV